MKKTMVILLIFQLYAIQLSAKTHWLYDFLLKNDLVTSSYEESNLCNVNILYKNQYKIYLVSMKACDSIGNTIGGEYRHLLVWHNNDSLYAKEWHTTFEYEIIYKYSNDDKYYIAFAQYTLEGQPNFYFLNYKNPSILQVKGEDETDLVAYQSYNPENQTVAILRGGSVVEKYVSMLSIDYTTKSLLIP